MLILKSGVRLFSLQPQMMVAVLSVFSVFSESGYDTIITSGNDSIHSTTSLHYAGAALDFRTRHIDPDKLPLLVNTILTNLGSDFDVILERDHLHIEYQPKRQN